MLKKIKLIALMGFIMSGLLSCSDDDNIVDSGQNLIGTWNCEGVTINIKYCSGVWENIDEESLEEVKSDLKKVYYMSLLASMKDVYQYEISDSGESEEPYIIKLRIKKEDSEYVLSGVLKESDIEGHEYMAEFDTADWDIDLLNKKDFELLYMDIKDDKIVVKTREEWLDVGDDRGWVTTIYSKK